MEGNTGNKREETSSEKDLLILKPEEIEKESFRRIDRELKEKGITLQGPEADVIRRVIHTTADFDYADTMRFSEGAVEHLQELLKQGTLIVTDTNMAKAGINKKKLERTGGEVRCFMAEPDVALEAKERGVTRAHVSMERAAALGRPVIFAVGNAPTALLSILELTGKNGFRPAFIIGVPVGFVNVEYAKERILETDLPYIVNAGRKGGSNVAAAIVNAVLGQIGTE